MARGLTIKSTEALVRRKAEQLGWLIAYTPGSKDWVKDDPLKRSEQMDLLELMMFCVFYSGIVIFALWMTITEDFKSNVPVQVRDRRN